jgi:Domain of unknown function (DUF5916)/Carbohydrate family 9 binding domain-like
MRFYFITVFIFFQLFGVYQNYLYAQNNPKFDPNKQNLNPNNPNENLQIRAVRADIAPKVDGILDDTIWSQAVAISNFTELSPNPNTASDYQTEVKVVYTNTDLYVGAQLYDAHPDSILKQLSRRDEIWEANTDFFGVYIDAMLTRQRSFIFIVTAAGVQYDADNYDGVWDAVWDSKVKINQEGWAVEIRIPYSQLRFPKAAAQIWGINFSRQVRRTREESFWAALNPTMDAEAQLYGKIVGINEIKPPVRLSFTPYLTSYLKYLPENRNLAIPEPTLIPTAGAGMDLKYGINQNFTVDMALIPDFGDIISDNFELNLSPFEQYFVERRPFFTEGIELFSRADLFYSRRIGATPSRYDFAYSQLSNGETVQQNPTVTRLINATKFSGRTKNRFGVGVFNAITAPSYATVINDSSQDVRKIKTEPLTNYNVIVADKQFGTNSYISFIQTSVLRFGEFTDAMGWGTDFRLVDEKNKYGFIGTAAYSQLWLDTALFNNPIQAGFRYNLSAQKLSGKIRWAITQNLCSKNFDINDLGFVTATNFITSTANGSYNLFKPFGWYNSMRINFTSTHTMLYNPNKFSQLKLRLAINSTFKNFLSAGCDIEYDPLGFNDFYEARNNFQLWAKPKWGRIGGWFSSDYRKTFALDGNASYRKFFSGDSTWANSYVVELRLAPRWRINDKFNLIFNNSILFRPNNIGYAGWDNQTNKPIFGSRYRQDLENILQMQYLFTPLISLSLRMRHYWSLVRYERYYNLSEEGQHLPFAYQNNLNRNFNAFNIDLIFRWRFALGSELNIVWKNAVLGSSSMLRYDYFDNFTEMFQANQRNIISAKALYFIDYFTLANKNKKAKKIF